MNEKIQIECNLAQCFSRIVPIFEIPVNSFTASLYEGVIQNTLAQILPESLWNINEDPECLEDQRKQFLELLPLLKHTPCHPSKTFSFFIIFKHKPNGFKFFFDMLTNWLIPGKRLTAPLFYTVDFRIPDLSNEIFTLCELTLYVSNEQDAAEIQRNLPIIESEVRLGIQSSCYARRILEIKGLTADVKTVMIQEIIGTLITRWPKYLDHNLLTEMQHVLVMCPDDFKFDRSCKHLSRIISLHYLFCKTIRTAITNAPERRHLCLKIFRETLHGKQVDRSVVGVLVGVNFLGGHEVFEERHLLTSIQNYISSAKAVEGSFFSKRRGSESICVLYIEVEKVNGEIITAEEIRLLRKALPSDLKDRIEHLMHPVFMARNEEEIMRNIFNLSNQIKYLHDLPQVIVSFDRQRQNELLFNVILVQIRRPSSISVQEVFKNGSTCLGYIHDHSKNVGYIHRKYPKEATVFTVTLSEGLFLRKDHSIDLNKARQAVIRELSKLFGEIRDFNGGMISRQHELLCALREQLKEIRYDELLLENFFYSLSPDIMRTVLDTTALKILFLLLLESIEDSFFSRETHAVKIRRDAHHVFAMIKAEDFALKETLARAFSKFEDQATQLACSCVLVYEVAYIGYLYICDDLRQQQNFCCLVQNNLLSLEQQRHSAVTVAS